MKPKPAADQFEELETEFETARSEFMELYEAADPADRPKLVEEKLPKAEDYVDRFFAIAELEPGSDAAADALVWIAVNGSATNAGAEAYKLLFENHLDNEKLKDVCFGLGYAQPAQQVEDRLNRLINDSPHDSVKAAATWGLANYLSRLERTREFIANNPDTENYDAETIAYVKARDSEPMLIESLFQTLADKYGDLEQRTGGRTFKEVAEGALFEINNLAIGMTPPDIEGEDLDGKSFKLSDYRGKVVVLDFWGDW